MSRKKLPRWSFRFELAPERPGDVRLHDYLDRLADNERASEWVRSVLLAAIPPHNGVWTPVTEKTDRDREGKL